MISICEVKKVQLSYSRVLMTKAFTLNLGHMFCSTLLLLLFLFLFPHYDGTSLPLDCQTNPIGQRVPVQKRGILTWA
jgi:hypothetical protein